MIGAIYKYLAIPESCRLGKRVFKSLFLQKAQLGAGDKKVFEQDVDSILWQYTLKPSTIPVAAYRDDQREYIEIAVLQANLRQPTRHARVAETIQRAIPYPLLLVLACDSRTALSLAAKRFNQADRGQIVVEEYFATAWLSPDTATGAQADFLADLNISRLPQTNFFALYNAWIARLVALQCAHFTGEYQLAPADADWQSRRSLLAECQRIEENIAELRRALQAETQFNRQVEWNMRIKRLEKELAEKGAGL